MIRLRTFVNSEMGRKKNNRNGPTPPNNRQPQKAQTPPSQPTQSNQTDTETKTAQIAALGAALDAAIATPIPVDGQSIGEAKLKLSEVQASVDAIKASLNQLKAEKLTDVLEKSNSDNGEAVGEAPFDTNTAKRKRNRNRKRNKGAGAKEATPTSDSNDDFKPKAPLEPECSTTSAVAGLISDVKPPAEAEEVIRDVDEAKTTAAEPDELKKSPKEEISVPIQKSVEPVESAEGLTQAEVIGSKISVKVPSKGKSAKGSKNRDTDGESNGIIPIDDTNKLEQPAQNEILEEKSEPQPAEDKKEDEGGKNKASVDVTVEPLLAEVKNSSETKAEMVSVEPIPSKSPSKQPTKKQQNKATKSQPQQPPKEEKSKPAPSVADAPSAIELKQTVPAQLEETPVQTQGENVKQELPVQQIECQTPIQADDEKPKVEEKPIESRKIDGQSNGKQASPKESKRKKAGRNAKPDEPVPPAVVAAPQPQSQPETTKLGRDKTNDKTAKSGPEKPNQSNQEPAKLAPVEQEPAQSDQLKSELIQPVAVATESAEPEPLETEQVKMELETAEPAKVVETKIVPAEPEPSKLESEPPTVAPLETLKTEPVRTSSQSSGPAVTENVKSQPAEVTDKLAETRSMEKAPEQVTSGGESKQTIDPKLEQIANATPPTTPTVTPKEVRKAITVHEDDTSRIWKILEEASKSLEPVEIEMDEGPPLTDVKPIQPKPTTTAPSITTDITADCKKVEILNSVLLEKEEKPSKKNEIALARESDKSQVTIPSSSNATPSITPTSTAKAIEAQPQKSNESKKKQQKSQAKNEKNPKPNKLIPQVTEAPQLTAEKQPSIARESSLTDVEIPLDMSIISSPNAEDVALNEASPLDDANQPKENVADSKNVRGSDFVPSVEQSTEGAKSLVATVATPTEQNPTEKGIAIAKEARADEQMRPEETNAKSKQTEAKSTNADVKPKSAAKSKNASSPKTAPANRSQKPSNDKKPSFPPKPDHLVSSKNKSKSPTTPTKAPPSPAQTSLKQLILDDDDDDDDEEVDYIEYKFMPRQVFICSICQACKTSLQSNARILCQLCQMITYCTAEHMQIDTAAHKELCTAIQEIAKKRGGHIYNNARVVNSNDYRSLRVHTLNICENLLKRPLQTFEREILLFPRLCGTATCREWRQNQLTDCPACHQVAYCTAHPDHLIENHQRWCKSFQLYEKLVVKQSVSGRIEPLLPTKIITKPYELPNNIDDVFKDLYENYGGKTVLPAP